MQIEEILKGLNEWDEEEPPADLLQAAVDAQDEIKPDLIIALEGVSKNPAKHVPNPDRKLYYWAVYLLCHFQAEEAFPALLEFFKLNNGPYTELVSEIIDEDGAMLLANMCGSNVDPIAAMLQDLKQPESNRAAAATALGFLCNWGELETARIEKEYREALKTLDEDSSWLGMELVNGATDLNLRGLGADVTKAFDRGVLDESDFDLVAEWLHDPDFEPAPPYLIMNQAIDDIVEFFIQKVEEQRLMDSTDLDAEEEKPEEGI